MSSQIKHSPGKPGRFKDGGRDCRIRSNNCYGQVSRRDQESALACWGIDR
ncbi:lysozyme [Escherichia coli O157:H7]|nr:lysozyme [Escherichia coli O157:H7]QRI16464.1 lysozyme [Escherichia coli O157:H7]